MYTAVYGRERTGYTTVHGPCRRSVHDPYTAVYGSALYMGVFTARVISRIRTVNTAVFRACLHGRVHSLYTALVMYPEVGSMGVGAGLYMYDVVVKKSSRSLSHLLMSSC